MSAGMIMDLKPKMNIPDVPPSSAQEERLGNSRSKSSSSSSSSRHKDVCSGVNGQTDRRAQSVLSAGEILKITHQPADLSPVKQR